MVGEPMSKPTSAVKVVPSQDSHHPHFPTTLSFPLSSLSSLVPNSYQYLESSNPHDQALQSALTNCNRKVIKMFNKVFLVVAAILAALAAAGINQSSATTLSVSTLFGTATLDFTATIVTTIAPTATEPSSKPVYTATQLYAYREGSPIHLLPIQARGLYFQLGGLPTTVCPDNVKDCPPGVLTGIDQCELVSTGQIGVSFTMLIHVVGHCSRWPAALSQARR